MQQILVYADSLSWGIIPGSRNRFRFNKRWPGILELELRKRGMAVRVIEDCLNGRRTNCNDPTKPGRNGVIGVEQRIEANSPLSLVIIFLGTNDFQVMHQNTPLSSAQGLSEIINAIRSAPVEPGMPVPHILLVAPPPIQEAKGEIAPKFEGAEHRATGLGEAIQQVAEENNCYFFDAGTVTDTSRVDGVHLDEDQHLILGKAVMEVVIPLVSTC